ncbi:hypothetical protein H0G86_006793 [Trichoderma simmonsii]|uniref:Uncharacterized protein n=1 Tax=Trichoderma simmonsii TaxID=1491479 RepID=A0A8G0LE73_9HYPO|nr:hypothetical protein H0G86_006793 [Trichoderma simmonsii]
MPATKQPRKGSREEAETKLANLKIDLRAVLKKIKDAEKEKEKNVDQIKHWKKELASRAREEDELNAEVEALFEQCGKKDEEVAKKAEENVGEESRTSWW